MESKKQTDKQTDSQIQRTNIWLPEGSGLRGGGEKGERDQEVQTSSYKINKPQGYNIQNKEYGQ